MSQGEKAAENVKSGIKGVVGATEDIRKNINSFADDLLGSNHESTGIHPHAKQAGGEAEAATEKAAEKLSSHHGGQTVGGSDPVAGTTTTGGATTTGIHTDSHATGAPVTDEHPTKPTSGMGTQ
ncbi:uncharacterized protein MYCFIDRAFT_81972 [Pseudocercospora fijiensis CIRAD86]|uniref:Uncharacterized protein n=1 Tax=Pseudocercospora fijiensis (strain CIRAD86) TaxID=383855 RepID=M3AN48_PSEFD|nr:uncharacterized protein MYCFIDRAFT_81972 [Pseudocercospora fijiensis CIRAD86]EME86026.1 hypothetical protein MYCFIDRAFT_81972 [Pseudocercospora fijiensis CIRAD86]